MEEVVLLLKKALNANGRTPKMWLKMICDKEGISFPSFDTTGITVAPSQFQAQVKLLNFHNKDYSALRFGPSKKEAEQEAAVFLLHQMGITPKDLAQISGNKQCRVVPDIQNGQDRENQPVVAAMQRVERPDLVPPDDWNLHSKDISPFSVNELVSLCVSRGYPPPIYREAGEDGPPHCKSFDMECLVQVPNHPEFIVTGRSNTKKKAKNLAAALMIAKIYKELPAIENEKETDMAAELASRLVDDTPKIICKDKMRCSQLFSHSHHRYKGLLGSVVSDLQQMTLTQDDLAFDPMKLLADIAKEQDLVIDYRHPPWKGNDGSWQCFCEVIYPLGIRGSSSCFMGEGKTSADSRRSAACSALEFLQEVSRP